MLANLVQVLAAVAVVGGCGFYGLVLVSARALLGHRRSRPGADGGGMRFSVLKPLSGIEPGLRENLESFYSQDYEDYEILFAARSRTDPGLELAAAVANGNPAVDSTVLAAGEPVSQNAKVHSLAVMTASAQGDVLVVSDSDVRAGPGLLGSLATEFSDPATGVVTCPYRAAGGPSIWSRLEAAGINTEFWSGVLAAGILMPMDFAVGPTMAVRRECLEEIGGWAAVADVLAEDFRIGRLAREAGWDVRLSPQVVEHRIGSQGLRENLAHRLRWRRSTRRSRPVGYVGEVFANPLPWAVLLAIVSGAAWSWTLLAVCSILRLAVTVAVARNVLGGRLPVRSWWLVPVQDFLSLVLWVAGFFGRTIVWRGARYELAADGSLRRVSG